MTAQNNGHIETSILEKELEINTMIEAEQILERQAAIEWLPVSQLVIDKDYQRKLSPSKVRGIVNKFDKDSVRVLEVSLRESGEAVVMDGQHRYTAMAKLGIEYALCKVHRGLTPQREAAIFVNCNQHVKNPEALDSFRASLMAQDPIYIAINAAVEKCGLTIQFYPPGGSHVGGSRKRPPKQIWATASLEEIYAKGKGELLEEVLMLILKSWPDDGAALQSKVLLGVTKFHLQYRGKYIREMLIARLNALDLNAILRQARNRYEVFGGSMVTSIAKSLQEIYDKGRRSGRLDPKS